MRAVPVALAVVVVAGFVAVNAGDKVEVQCGPTVSSPLTMRGIERGQKWGQSFKKLTDGDVTLMDTMHAVRGTMETLTLWYSAFHHEANGVAEDGAVTGWRNRTQEKQAAALASCCVTYTGPTPQDPGGGQVDPRILTVSNSRTSASGGEKAVWDELRSRGLSETHTAAIMGNMKVESGFDPLIVQGGRKSNDPSSAGSGGYGLVQWTPGRKLEGYIGSAQPTVGNQVSALLSQLAGKGPHPETSAGRAFYAARSLDSATRVFHLQYERSRSKDSTERIRNAREIMQRRGNSPVPPSDPGGNGPSITVPGLPNATDPNAPAQAQCVPTTGGGGGYGTGSSTGTATGLLNGTPTLVATLNPAGHGNWQGAVKDGGYWYVAQAKSGNRSAIIHRLNGSGSEIDQMTVSGGGEIHPTQFGVANGTVYMEVGTTTRKFRYQPGATISDGSATDTGWKGHIAIDPNGKVAVTRWGGYQRYDLATGRKIGKKISGGHSGVGQGFGLTGNILYTLSGATNAHAEVRSYSFSTGKHIATKTVTHLGQGKKHREPEGMWGQLLGVKVGGGDKRRFNIYDLRDSAPITSIGNTGKPKLSGSAPPGYPIRNGMAPNTARGREIIRATFGINLTVPQCAIQRSGHVSGSYHYTGHACDVMVGGSKGHTLSRWARANAAQLGVVEVIHNRQIWTANRDSDGWRAYSGPSSHEGHVHLSFDRSRKA